MLVNRYGTMCYSFKFFPRYFRSSITLGQTRTILGIETSCGAAIVRSDGKILANVVYSQHKLHEKFGGIVPGIAMEAHKRHLGPVIKEALMKAGIPNISGVDGIAVTRGPGLEICLRIGMREAQRLAFEFSKPLVSVHHLEAHCLVARLAATRIEDVETKSSIEMPNANRNDEHSDSSSGSIGEKFTPRVEYPFLALLVSGGHTQLMICKGLGDYVVIGCTLDDSLGESFDKAARLMGINDGFVNGGPLVEKLARQGDPSVFSQVMTVPMLKYRDCNFSYAGLKNSFRMAVMNARVEYGLDKTSTNAPSTLMAEVTNTVALPTSVAADLSASFQHVAFRHVEDRVFRAMAYVHDKELPVRSLVVVGGVAANLELRRTLLEVVNRANEELLSANGCSDSFSCKNTPWSLYFPPPALCTDNGVMVAWAGIEKMQAGIVDDFSEITGGGFEPIPRWPIGPAIPKEDEAIFRKRIKAKNPST